MGKTLVVIVGATASGKTALAIKIAKLLEAEIISADSRQFYQQLTIGTAKPSKEELQMVRHHFIDIRRPDEYYSAGDFEREALGWLENWFQEHNYAVLAGGSGLYVKALCEGMDEMPEVDHQLRNELIANHQLHGVSWLVEKLKQLDPEKLALIDQQNPQRLMRAIENASQQVVLGRPKKERPFKIVKIGIHWEREELYQRINQRVDIMMQAGLLEEVKGLTAFKGINALKTVGYEELFDYLEGKHSLAKAVELIKQHTRNYAKRQITWFKRDSEIIWINPEMANHPEKWLFGMLD